MASVTKQQYAWLICEALHIHKTAIGPHQTDSMQERGWCERGYKITDAGRQFVREQMANPTGMPTLMKRGICEDEGLRARFAHLFTHDPNPAIRVAALGVHALEPKQPPTSIDGLRGDMIYRNTDMDMFATPYWTVMHMMPGADFHQPYLVWRGNRLDSLTDKDVRRNGATCRYASTSFFTEES